MTPPSRLPLLAAALILASPLVARPARADEPPTPVFEGHPWLSTYTKEVAGDGSAVRLGDGRWALGAGSSMAAFYKPWLSIQGGAQGSFGLGKSRQTYDTRALLRFVLPQPVLSRVFVYAGVGLTVFFSEIEAESAVFRRTAGAVGAAGLWVQATDRLRLRAEVRDHWLFVGRVDLPHNLFFTLSLATLYR